ncbi:unnamed protein product [Closterium sp. NIES-53]
MFEAKIRARNQKARATNAAIEAVSGKSAAKGKGKRGRMEDFYGEVVSAAGPNYVPPKRHYVGGAGLLECKQRIEKALSPVTRSWRETGVTIASDMMQDKGGRAQMNIICINDIGAVFVEAVDCKAATKRGVFIVGVLQPIIERIGPEHVVALCTDGGSNYKAAGKLLQKAWPHLDLVSRATHVLDLLMEDIGKMDWAQVVVTQADNMISFVRGHQWTRAFMRSPELHGEEKLLQVLRPAGMRFGTQFIAVSRLRAVMELFYNVMRGTDSTAKGMMGQLYDNMLQLTEELDKLLDGRECKLSRADKEKVREHLRRRWDESLACPLHVAGRILNPANQEEGIFL